MCIETDRCVGRDMEREIKGWEVEISSRLLLIYKVRGSNLSHHQKNITGGIALYCIEQFIGEVRESRTKGQMMIISETRLCFDRLEPRL